MNCIRHLCCIADIKPEWCAGEYPKILLPINDTCNILQYFVYSMAELGCRTIWIISNDLIQNQIRELVGDYIIDPAAYRFDKEKSKKQLIPIYYLKPVGNTFNTDHRSESEAMFGAVKTIEYASSAVSNYLIPNKYIYTHCTSIFDLEFCRKLKPKLLDENDKTNYLFVDPDNNNMGCLLTQEDSNFIYRIHKGLLKKKKKLVYHYLDEIMYSIERPPNSHYVGNLKDYSKAVFEDKITEFVYPEEFLNHRKFVGGLDQPFIGKDTVINIKVNKTKKPKEIK